MSTLTLKQRIEEDIAFAGSIPASEFGIQVAKGAEDYACYPIHVSKCFERGIDPDYVFSKQHMKIIQLWLLGNFKNLMLTGPTGSGKTQLISQVAARTGWPLYDVACSETTEADDILYTRSLVNGNTAWEEGPGIKAMKEGGILLLDEFNLMQPGQLAGLHKLLDHTGFMSKQVDENGKPIFIKPHPNFRVACAGNAVNGEGAGSYAGIVRHQNIATINRMDLTLVMDYLSEELEMKILQGKFPGLSNNCLRFLLDLANGTRQMHKAGKMNNPISTRKLCHIANILELHKVFDEETITEFIKVTYINTLPPQHAQPVLESLRKLIIANGLNN